MTKAESQYTREQQREILQALHDGIAFPDYFQISPDHEAILRASAGMLIQSRTAKKLGELTPPGGSFDGTRMESFNALYEKIGLGRRYVPRSQIYTGAHAKEDLLRGIPPVAYYKDMLPQDIITKNVRIAAQDAAINAMLTINNQTLMSQVFNLMLDQKTPDECIELAARCQRLNELFRIVAAEHETSNPDVGRVRQLLHEGIPEQSFQRPKIMLNVFGGDAGPVVVSSELTALDTIFKLAKAMEHYEVQQAISDFQHRYGVASDGPAVGKS